MQGYHSSPALSPGARSSDGSHSEGLSYSPPTTPLTTPPARRGRPPARLVRHPNAANINVQMHRSVTMLNESFRPSNTVKCHKGKILEFFEYCDEIYPHDPYKYNLTDEKVFRFMYYQAFRQLKSRGGKKNTGAKKYFDRASYDTVIGNFDGVPVSPSQNPMPVQSAKPMSWSSWNQYQQVIVKIYNQQRMDKVCSLYWDDIWQQPCKDLNLQVKRRVPHVKKSTYQEKVSAEFAPYTIVEHYPDIEQELWNDCLKAAGPRQIVCQLRHRYCAQHTASGILRAESLYRAEWSDFLMISPPKNDTDVHPISIMVNQVSQGKTNNGRLLYGRAIRHRDVRLCAIGSLALYMMYRFYVTDEFRNMTVEDWLNNETWFDIKLLSDTIAEDNTKEIHKDTYGDHIQRVLTRLGLPMNKLLHLGRNIGSKILELLEEEDEAIRKMGNWNPSVFDNSYSAKLPMGPMRKLAGYHGNHKLYYNTRTVVEPPECLLRSTPIGQWVYDLHAQLIEDPRINDHPTAMFVVNFFMQMNRIFIQDMTAMAVLHPDRMEHAVYKEFPVFNSTQWDVSWGALVHLFVVVFTRSSFLHCQCTTGL
jgi:Centromere DNA-binding protein complex CBF3 subunit, domain 2